MGDLFDLDLALHVVDIVVTMTPAVIGSLMISECEDMTIILRDRLLQERGMELNCKNINIDL